MFINIDAESGLLRHAVELGGGFDGEVVKVGERTAARGAQAHRLGGAGVGDAVGRVHVGCAHFLER
ncbi:MAG: hypothetical protein ACK56I_34660, partial [bacterium]